MPKSLSQLKTELQRLEQRIVSIQSGVIARIKSEIAKHGLTAADLFGGFDGTRLVASKVGARGTGRGGAGKVAGKSRAVKFADAQGNTWGGIGKRPDWIKSALAKGQSLDEFLVAGSGVVAPAPVKQRSATSGAAQVKTASLKKVAVKKGAEAPVVPVKKKTAKAAAKTQSAPEKVAASDAKAVFGKVVSKKSADPVKSAPKKKTARAKPSASAPDRTAAS